MGKVLIAPEFSSTSVEGNIYCFIDWYSSLEKLVTCFVKRFVRNLKERVGRGECLEKDLTVAELNEAKQKDSPMPDPNKFILPTTENMPFLMICFKMQA